MIAALLHGRTHLNFQEFRQQNHLTFFLHVLGVLELLQPQVFQSEHQGALWDCLRSFIGLLLVRAAPLKPLPSQLIRCSLRPGQPRVGAPGSLQGSGDQRAREGPRFPEAWANPRFSRHKGASGAVPAPLCLCRAWGPGVTAPGLHGGLKDKAL